MTPYDSANALEAHECPKCGFEHTHKFCWQWGKFWVGKVSNKLLAFIVYMVLQFILLLGKFVPDNIKWITVIVSFAITGIFMLAGAIDQAVANAKITAEFKASLAKEVKLLKKTGKGN